MVEIIFVLLVLFGFLHCGVFWGTLSQFPRICDSLNKVFEYNIWASLPNFEVIHPMLNNRRNSLRIILFIAHLLFLNVSFEVKNRVIVIGGGAAGYFSALQCANVLTEKKAAADSEVE